MAMVSGRCSTLNPNAPLFVPASVKKVEDFSPEWWKLVTTSTWYHDYWISQNQGPDGFYDDKEANVADLLPESFDFDDIDDCFDYEEFDQGFNGGDIYQASSEIEVLGKNGEIVKKSTRKWSPRMFVESAKYVEKPAKWSNQKVTPRNIHQPR
ncbi:unnamed protein product [Cochlearia groenlandica]